jgi:PBSX family phage terminase large subunit
MPDYIDSEGRLDLAKVYYPTPKIRELHTSPAPYRAAVGGAGSGKSWFLLWEAVYYCCLYPGCHVLLLRKDFNELNKGLIQDFLASVPPELYKYNASDHIATFFNKSKLFFGHCENLHVKDLNQYLSAGFSFIGIDEAGEFPFEIWDFLTARNRNKVSGPTPTMALATNPYGIGWGWVKKLFIDKKPVEQLEKSGTYESKNYFYNHSTILDNPHLMAKDPDYINRLNRLSPALRQKMLYGDINSVAGQYYTNFSHMRHVVDLRKDPDAIKWQSWQPKWMGGDWGLAHHSAFYWYTRALVKSAFDGTYKNKVVCYHEWVTKEMSYEDLAKGVIRENGADKILHFFFSPERFNRTDPNNTPADQLNKALRANQSEVLIPPVARASDDRVAGATLIYNLFDSDELAILDTCPGIIQAIPSLVRGGKNGKDLEDVMKANTVEDDEYDGFRYGLLSYLNPKGKPREIEIREHAEQIEDKVSRHFYMMKQQANLQSESEAFVPKYVPLWETRIKE